MTKSEEAAFEVKAEKYFSGQRELPCGRDFRWNSIKDPKADTLYRKNMDTIFPNAPGAGF